MFLNVFTNELIDQTKIKTETTVIVIGIIGRDSTTDIIYVCQYEITSPLSEIINDKYSDNPETCASLKIFIV